jgi:Domain of unknown function (DUF4258)
MKSGKRPKIIDLIWHVRELVENGALRYSAHVEERMAQREIIKPEVEFILRKGHHNPEKDKFDEEYESWDYAIEGKTIDNRKLRIIIAFVEPNILVVTAINLDNLWKEK